MYVGKVVTMPTKAIGGLFDSKNEFIVTGFSAKTGRVTLKWKDFHERYEETDCYNIPD